MNLIDLIRVMNNDDILKSEIIVVSEYSVQKNIKITHKNLDYFDFKDILKKYGNYKLACIKIHVDYLDTGYFYIEIYK